MKRSLTIMTCLLLMLAPLNAAPVQEQKPQPPHNFYKVVFVISELENGTATNQRRYTMMAKEDRPTVVKTGSRVPIATGSKNGDTQFQYMDVGFNAVVNISAADGNIALSADIDISNVVPAEKDVPSSISAPMVRQVHQNVNAWVESGKPEVISVTDDVNSKKSVQVEVTVTRLSGRI